MCTFEFLKECFNHKLSPDYEAHWFQIAILEKIGSLYWWSKFVIPEKKYKYSDKEEVNTGETLL